MMQGKAVYLDAIYGTKEEEKKEILESPLNKIFELEEEPFIDIEITCFDPEDKLKKILEGVPPVWLVLKSDLS